MSEETDMQRNGGREMNTKTQHTLNLSTATASDADIRAAADAQKRRILENAGYFEMAEALRALLNQWDSGIGDDLATDRRLFDQARAALAKAGL